MKKYYFLFLTQCCFFFFLGCSSSPQQPYSKTHINQSLSHVSTAKSYLGTPYKYGGNNHRGIDCSGLVHNSFKTSGKYIPRIARLQARQGVTIKRSALRQGDLVFFKTGGSREINHVGIMVNKHAFIHSSSSKGVIISKLSNVYWSPRYVTAKRIN